MNVYEIFDKIIENLPSHPFEAEKRLLDEW